MKIGEIWRHKLEHFPVVIFKLTDKMVFFRGNIDGSDLPIKINPDETFEWEFLISYFLEWYYKDYSKDRE